MRLTPTLALLLAATTASGSGCSLAMGPQPPAVTRHAPVDDEERDDAVADAVCVPNPLPVALDGVFGLGATLVLAMIGGAMLACDGESGPCGPGKLLVGAAGASFGVTTALIVIGARRNAACHEDRDEAVAFLHQIRGSLEVPACVERPRLPRTLLHNGCAEPLTCTIAWGDQERNASVAPGAGLRWEGEVPPDAPFTGTCLLDSPQHLPESPPATAP